MLAPFPPQLRRTVSFDNGTFDNGTEFAHHYQLHNLGIQTFFCGTHSPGRRGRWRNGIGRLRRYLPKKTDLALLPGPPA